MKICTVNVPESYITAINKLIGENGLYPSRSELVRCAVREFLLKELKMAKHMKEYDLIKEEEKKKENVLAEKNIVRVPFESKDEDNKPVREFKTFKIIQRLD